MTHISKTADSASPICGAVGECVQAALSSDCDKCRSLLFIGPMKHKGCSLRPVPTWEPQPYPGAETWLEEVQRVRRGDVTPMPDEAAAGNGVNLDQAKSLDEAFTAARKNPGAMVRCPLCPVGVSGGAFARHVQLRHGL